MSENELVRIARSIRKFEGLTRKQPISDYVSLFSQESMMLLEGDSYLGDDAALLDVDGEHYMLFAADGVWSRLMVSPWWAGYSSVLVNVNDIAAMGGVPLGMVNVVSSSRKDVCTELGRGIAEGIKKFGVPMMGGHLHPDTPYDSLAVAILGRVRKGCEIRSDTASGGDVVIAAYDLDGRVGPNSPYSWESTAMKQPKDIARMYRCMVVLGEAHLLSAGKDVSNPGLIGTLGMLCESSGLGATVQLESIPKPEKVDVSKWVLVHPATGFVVSTPPRSADEVIGIFEQCGLSAAAVGTLHSEKKVHIASGGESAVVFDLERDTITGLSKEDAHG
ncbi:MAG: methanogenesis marker 2 protein [Methermicoccaceae archaeon]